MKLSKKQEDAAKIVRNDKSGYVEQFKPSKGQQKMVGDHLFVALLQTTFFPVGSFAEKLEIWNYCISSENFQGFLRDTSFLIE